MAIKKGICKNYGECDIADTKPLVIQEADSTNFVCEECGSPLTEYKESTEPNGGNKLKIILASIAGLAIVGGGGAFFLSSGDITPRPEQVTLTKSASELNVGETDTLQAMVTPREATVQLEWTSSDANIVSVESGVVKALAEGKAQISVQVAGTEGLTDVCIYTVTKKEIEVIPEPENSKEIEVMKPLNGKGTVDLGYASYTGDLKNGKPHGYGTLTYKKSQKIVPSKDFVAKPGDTFEGEFRDGRISGLGYWKHDGNQTVVKP